MKYPLTLLLFLFTPLVFGTEYFPNCNTLIQHSTSKIIRELSPEHAAVYNWHNYCGLKFSSKGEAKQASTAIFGLGSSNANNSPANQLQKLNEWCSNKKSFALKHELMYSEAAALIDETLTSFNQCQHLASQGVFVSINPSGKHSDFVNFDISSDYETHLRMLPMETVNYNCKTFISSKSEKSEKKGPAKKTNLKLSPLIDKHNFTISCKRKTPKIKKVDGYKRLTYEKAYISLQTSGPSLQFYADEVVDDYLSTPPKSVVAFNSANCPSGWKEYRKAYGRFIRGIDRGGKTDPDGERSSGSTQSDSATIYNSTFIADNDKVKKPTDSKDSKEETSDFAVDFQSLEKAQTDFLAAHGHTVAGGGFETRPKNVALLYCEKL